MKAFKVAKISKTMVKLTVAEYLTRKIDESGKTQKEIATEIGYENPNIITMFKQGHTKLPLTTVGPFAEALNVDPAYLLRMVMAEYYPDTYRAVESCLGTMILTDHERNLIKAYRLITKDADPEVLILEESRVFALAFS
jgi:hypothetical protein